MLYVGTVSISLSKVCSDSNVMFALPFVGIIDFNFNVHQHLSFPDADPLLAPSCS